MPSRTDRQWVVEYNSEKRLLCHTCIFSEFKPIIGAAIYCHSGARPYIWPTEPVLECTRYSDRRDGSDASDTSDVPPSHPIEFEIWE